MAKCDQPHVIRKVLFFFYLLFFFLQIYANDVPLVTLILNIYIYIYIYIWVCGSAPLFFSGKSTIFVLFFK